MGKRAGPRPSVLLTKAVSPEEGVKMEQRFLFVVFLFSSFQINYTKKKKIRFHFFLLDYRVLMQVS